MEKLPFINKRGSVLDTGPILVSLFIMALFALVMILVITEINDAFQLDDDVPAEAKSIMASGSSQVPGIFDFWFAILFVGLPLISAVLAYFSNIHPLFFWISVLLVVLMIFIGQGLSELWLEVVADSSLSSSASSMPIANYVLSNFGLYSLFIFVIIAFGTFVKMRGRDAYGSF